MESSGPVSRLVVYFRTLGDLVAEAIKRWKQIVAPVSRRQAICPRPHVRLEFTGESPSNPAEVMVERVARGQKSVPLRWLKEQLAEAMYQEQLRNGGWIADIGLWGAKAYLPEAGRLLEGVHPRFAFLVEGEGQPETAKSWESPASMGCTSRFRTGRV